MDLIIGDRIGAQPRLAVPDCLALTSDRETLDAAATIAQVLFDDLEFEREFRMLARDTYRTIPRARSLTDLPLDAWRELGADGVVSCSVSRQDDGQLVVRARLFNVRALDSTLGREYTGSYRNVRRYAHALSDEIHRQQRGLEGVARSHLAFVSDRDSESVLGLVPNRQTKEIYVADYDGANVRRVTVSRSLNVTPTWTPDARAIAYTSYRSGQQDIVVSHIYEGRLETPAGGTERVHNWLPAYSPDGRQIAFNSNRDGNPELYVANVDGTNLRRLTNHPAIDTSPTWSPLGHQIAFTSDRTGSPQILRRGRRRRRSAPHHVRIVLRQAHLVAEPVQRNRLHVSHRSGSRHQGRRPRHERSAATHVRTGHEREPELFGERPPPGLFLHPGQRQQADLRDRERRTRAPADHVHGQQRNAELVTMIRLSA